MTASHDTTLETFARCALIALSLGAFACGDGEGPLSNNGPGNDLLGDAELSAFEVQANGALAATLLATSEELRAQLEANAADGELTFTAPECVTSSPTSETVTVWTLSDCVTPFGQATVSGTLTTTVLLNAFPEITYTAESDALTVDGESASLSVEVNYNLVTTAVSVTAGAGGVEGQSSTNLTVTPQDAGCAEVDGSWDSSGRGQSTSATVTDLVVCEGACAPSSGSASVTRTGGRLSDDETTFALTFGANGVVSWSADEETGEVTLTCRQ